MRHSLLLIVFSLSGLAAPRAALAEKVSCKIVTSLEDGSKNESSSSGEVIRVQGENESEQLTLKKSGARWMLKVESTIDGKPYITDAIACTRSLSCEGKRIKVSAKRTKEEPFDIIGSNYQARVQLKERLLFTFYRTDTEFVYNYINYPRADGTNVGVELTCEEL